MAEIYTDDRNLKPSVYYDAVTKLYKVYFEGTYDSVGLYLSPAGMQNLIDVCKTEKTKYQSYSKGCAK